MIEFSSLFPRNSSRTSTQAISVPITALIATTISDEINVSLIAATASLSVIASKKCPSPSREATADHRGQREQNDEADPEQRGAAGETRAAEGGSEAHPRRSGYSGVG